MKPPKLNPGASANQRSHRAKKELLMPLGLPAEMPSDWQAVALRKLDELRHQYRSLQLYLDICVRCGACADKCQFFLGTGDPNNMPVARAELLRKVYRRYFTPSGKLGGRLAAAEDLTDKVLDEWYAYFYQCSECRRCAVFCPYGIDTAEITMAAREIMASVGVATKYVTEVVKKAHEIGNNLGIPEAAWRDSCQFLEEEMKEETGADIKIPVNQPGAEVLLVPPSADLFANTDTMIGYAKLFHAAGVSWTTSTYASEAGNFGLFLNYEHLKKVNKRLVDAAKQLKVKRLVIGECGHAWRAAQAFMDTLNGPLDFLDAPRPEHICEFAARLIRDGRVKLNKTANDGVVVTYHDPCNVARAGGMLEEPREILRAVVSDFREMPADTIRERTFCCGAGGGMLADELMDVRMKGAKPRVEAFKTTGANFLATPCAICKAQLPVAFQHHGVEAQVGGVMDLLGKAIVI
ncbi:MAG: (Fe-S)-binding protein [Verrucomicrobia bacterium]|nr:(Fe-S)-binding protein [Verrucomicrobiota bacterium]